MKQSALLEGKIQTLLNPVYKRMPMLGLEAAGTASQQHVLSLCWQATAYRIQIDKWEISDILNTPLDITKHLRKAKINRGTKLR